MNVHWILMDVLRHVPTIHLGASHVHAMPAIISMLMAKLAMVGHMYTHNNHTKQNITVFYTYKYIQTGRLAIHKIPIFP